MVVAAAAVFAATAAVAVGGSAAAQSDGDCYAGLVVGPGQRCTYPGTTQEFWVDDSGRGHFIFFTAGTGIDARGTTINGVTYNFKASKQADGTWLIEAAGTTTTTTTTTTTPATTTTTTPTTTTTTPATTTTTTPTTTTTTTPTTAVAPGRYSDVAGTTHEAAIGALEAQGVFDRTDCAPGRFCPRDALPVGAGNSAVVVDLPRCGPMLSPRVPNLVPIPGPGMERETPGQRPRPNYGHPRVS